MIKQRRYDLKHWYKKYSEFPPEIIKQIIEFKTNQKHSIHDRIQTIKEINRRIELYRSSQNISKVCFVSLLKYPKFDSNDGSHINSIKYDTFIPMSDRELNIKRLIKIRRDLINSIRYDYRIKRSF